MKPPFPSPPTHEDVLDGFKTEVTLRKKPRRSKWLPDPLSFFDAEQTPAVAAVVEPPTSQRVLDVAAGGEVRTDLELAPLVTAALMPAATRRRLRALPDRFAPHAAIGLAGITTLVAAGLALWDGRAGTNDVRPPEAVVAVAGRVEAPVEAIETMPLDELVTLATPIARRPASSLEASASTREVDDPKVVKPIDSRSRRTEITIPSAPVPIADVSRLAPIPSPSPPMPAVPPSGATREPPRAATTPPSTTSSTPPATASGEALDTVAIQHVLGEYRNAFTARDSSAAKAVWPAVDEQALSRAFERLREQAFHFSQCNIAISGDRATASCSGTASYVPKVGRRNSNSELRQWWFNLRKVNDAWLIDQVDTR